MRISSERIEAIKNLSKEPDIYERLASALGEKFVVLFPMDILHDSFASRRLTLYSCDYISFVAPSIYENEDIKKGILLQLFGGAKKDFIATGRGHFRFEHDLPFRHCVVSASLHCTRQV